MTAAAATAGYLGAPGARLYYQLWNNGTPRARVVLLHGLESHSGWFDDFGARLAAFGYAVVAVDRAGAGRSDGRRGDLTGTRGLFAQLRTVLCEVTPSLPTFVLGFSWGARWALAQAVTCPAESHGLIVMAPGLCLRDPYPAWRRAAVLAGALCRPAAQVPTPVTHDECFTTRAAALAYIRADPRRLSRVTARLLMHSWILERTFARHAARLRTPVLHLIAGQDAICDNARNRQLLRGALSEGLYAERVYADAEHALMFECDRYPIAADVAGWIASHSSS
ncbi:MAG TPA: alpha/beta fold hydrolase [Vicinamibacterales bacterium]|nr:alpha/beta fold hydrolase [Vicinamibacterales bacterium]